MTWRIQLVRSRVVPETRFWRRHVLGRHTRIVVEVVGVFDPSGATFTKRLNGSTELSLPSNTLHEPPLFKYARHNYELD